MNSFSIKSLILAIIISCVGILSTYSISLKVASQLKTESYLKIENIAEQISIRFQDAIDKSVNDLQGLQAFYSANKEHLSQYQFNQYMKVLNIKERDYIQALSWVPLVRDDERDEFEGLLKTQETNFKITEKNGEKGLVTSQVKPYYTPVSYVSPYDFNNKAIGFDLNSNDIRRHSLELARNSGKMVTTAKIQLVQQSTDSAGFLIIAPVYKQGFPTGNIEQRIDALLGYATGVFRIVTLMEKAKARADTEGLKLTLLDINKENGSLLYGQEDNNPFFSFDLTIPDRKWQLNLSLNDDLLTNIESPSVIKWILASGIIISLLLAFAVYALQVAILRAKNITILSNELQDQNNRLEKKVVNRTQSLADKNTELKVNVVELKSQRVLLSRLMKEAESAKILAEQRSIDLARSNKDLDDFAYVASHDLKAPLRGIDQLATWVVEDIEEGNLEEIPDHLKMMRSRIGRLETLLSDLLTYSQASHQNNSFTDINTDVLVNDLFMLVAPLNGFTLKINDPLPNFSTCRAPFEQVIRNLLSNAIKHHHKNEGVIEIGYLEIGEFYQFSVKDDGPGISLKYQEEIFQMFKTLRPRDEAEGSGMGLALIKKIVEHNSGQVKVESSEGKGCTFYFTWPKIITT